MMPSSADEGSAVTNETELTEIGGASNNSTQMLVESDNVGESLPSPEEIRATVNPQPASKGGCCKGKGNLTLIVFIVGLVLAVIFAVGLGVGLSNREGGNEQRSSTVSDIQLYMVDRGLSSEASFKNFDSPQYKAAKWLAMDDPQNLHAPSPHLGIEDEAAYPFVLRYVMAVLYYSTNGGNWRYQFNFLTHRNTCGWNGVLLSSAGGFISFGLICNQQKRAFAIYLDQVRMTGELPNELKALTTLRILDFNFNDDLGGTIPFGICELVNLESLAIGYNKITGNIPGCFNALDKLKLLFLPDTQMQGDLPTLSGMVSLQRLFLDDNDFSGDISTAFDDLTELRFLFLEDNEFTGTVGPNFLKQNTKLIQVDISDNNLVGELSPHLFEMEQIQLVDFHDNVLTGSLPEFVASEFLLFIALHGNELTGDITTSITNLYNLFHLDLSANNLNGTIDHLGTMSNLTYLFISHNNFQPGPIPASFSALTSLEELSLKATKRTGELPEFISNFTNLELLDLDKNDFNGTIPASYGNLVNLEFLLLNRNQLSGDVPQSFSQLVKLRAAFLEDNLLTGNLAHLCQISNFNELEGDLDGDEMLVADCDGGTVQCDCCICCNPASSGDDEKCNDKELIANLDPIWEDIYRRKNYDFGDDIRFVDRSFLP